ncbi:MAG: hypothetical protein AAGA60_29200 [Cyanobacteria bacterium P01_E01_bin.42]
MKYTPLTLEGYLRSQIHQGNEYQLAIASLNNENRVNITIHPLGNERPRLDFEINGRHAIPINDEGERLDDEYSEAKHRALPRAERDRLIAIDIPSGKETL